MRRLVAAQVTTVGPNDAIGWDYLDADMTIYDVSRFEASWDDSEWTTLGIPPSIIDAETQSGARTYKATPSFTGGNHTVSFRACNAAGPGGASSPFRLRIVKRTAGGAE
jgi:hypothetical protein